MDKIMDRFKRQEIINRACASFKDPLLPEYVYPCKDSSGYR